MRVAPGTIVILSGSILAYPTIGAALDDMAKHHELALSTYVIEGLREVVARKWPASGPLARTPSRGSCNPSPTSSG